MSNLRLGTLTGVADPATVADDNFEAVDRALFTRLPDLVGGVATTVIGPPAAGAHVEKEVWCDAYGAWWLCTAAGAPGTWKQLTPALLTADPASGTIPTGYLIARADLDGLVKVHAGSYVWPARRTILDAYAVADLPSAASHTNRLVVCPNGNAGAWCLAVSNGTNWLRVVPGAAVAAS
jgi:hypothetical protein